MPEVIRWGILGTGSIAKKFAQGLADTTEADLVAVGSRTKEKADAFADQFQIPIRYASYQDLATDPKVDLVYVATPHPFHCENTILCLENRKGVLCEKPFALNQREAKLMIKTARKQNTFLMEAMWTRFMPAMVQLRQLLAKGVIGEVRMLTADFGFRSEVNPENRLFNLELGGGALLDVGVYTVSLSSMVFGQPSQIATLADIGQTGVDEQAGVLLLHNQGQISILNTAIRTNTPQEAMLMGTEGQIKIESPWWIPTRLTVKGEMYDIPFEGNGYNYEAMEAMNCFRAGQIESQIMPHQETLSIMKSLDQIRQQWNLAYPSEQKD